MCTTLKSNKVDVDVDVDKNFRQVKTSIDIRIRLVFMLMSGPFSMGISNVALPLMLLSLVKTRPKCYGISSKGLYYICVCFD